MNTPNTILQTLNAIVDDMEFFDDWEDRYRYIIDLGKTLPTLPEELRTSANKVDGCVSQVWLISDFQAPLMHFRADSDAFIVRGLIAVLMKLFDGRTCAEILDMSAQDCLAKLQLDTHLSPNRRNGLVAMVEKIRHDAKRNITQA